MELGWLQDFLLGDGGAIAAIGWLIPTLVGGASAFLNSDAQGDAADTAIAGQREAIASTERMYQQNRTDLAPWREAGATALDAALSLVGLPGFGAPQRRQGPVPNAATEDRINRADFRASGGGNRYTRDTNYWGDGPGGSDLHYQPFHSIPGMAQGGFLPEGGTAMVGEHGPELAVPQGGSYGGALNPYPVGVNGPEVIQPNQGTQIIPNPATPQATTGGAPSYNPNSALTGPAENPGGQPGRYNFMTDPGYNFRFGEGMRALDYAAGARGRRRGSAGDTGPSAMERQVIRYGQGIASQEFTNVFNRISAIAGLGQTATNQQTAVTSQASNDIASGYANIGIAGAQGRANQGNVWGNAFANIASNPAIDWSGPLGRA